MDEITDRRGQRPPAHRVVQRLVDRRPVLRAQTDGAAAGAGDDGTIGITGYAAVFDENSVPLWDWWEGAFIERISPGAFTKTLKDGADVRLLIDHNPSLLLARNTAGTLRLAEDAIGLSIDADVAPTSYALDLAQNLRVGNVSQMSFAFRIVRETWTETHDGLPLRSVDEAALSDVSVVSYPAYPQTAAGLRSRLDAIVNEIAGDPTGRAPLLGAAQQALADVVRQLAPPATDAGGAIGLDLARRRLALARRRAGVH